MVDGHGRSRRFARGAGSLLVAIASLAVVRCGGNSASQGPGGGSSDAGDGPGVGGTGASAGTAGDAGEGTGGTGNAGEGGSGAAGAGGAGVGGVGGAGMGGAGVGGAGVGGAGVGGGGTTSTGGCVSSKSECPDPGGSLVEPMCLTTDLFCATRTCDATLEDALARFETICPTLTAALTPLSLTRGCGFQTLGLVLMYGSEWQVFDDDSGDFVGAKFLTDSPYGPCLHANYETGTQFPICTEAVTCRVCVDDDPRAPRCRFDCDCDNIEPGIDPCFGPESCECYCSELAATAGL